MVSLQHQASSVESPKSLCLYPPQHNRADNITSSLLSFVYSGSLERYTDCLMLSVCTSHSGAPTSAQAGMNCCNINAFLICAIWSKNVSPLWEGDINAKRKKDLTWVQNKRKDEDWTCGGWGMLLYRSIFQAKPFHRSDASLTKRSLLVRSCQSALWKQVFQVLNSKNFSIKQVKKTRDMHWRRSRHIQTSVIFLAFVKPHAIDSAHSLGRWDTDSPRGHQRPDFNLQGCASGHLS